MEGRGRCGGTGLEELSELWTLGPAELVLVGGLPDAGKLGLAARSAVAISPARRTAELSSRVALPPALPTVIRSAWLEGWP